MRINHIIFSDALLYCNDVKEAIALFGLEEEKFNNRVFINALCMPIMQIGELCKLVSEEFKAEYYQIDWRG